MKIHVVQSGDTLWKIAQHYGITTNQIVTVNGLDNPSRLVIGESLVILGSGLAAKYGVASQYNETYQSPFFRYFDESGQQHEVWFEDARSMQAKYDTVKEYKLRGLSYWVLGPLFPQNWPLLAGNFTPKKR